MVLFYTIIFSYWPSESCENFSCSENISFIIHLSAVYLNIRFNKVYRWRNAKIVHISLDFVFNQIPTLLRNIHFPFSQQHLSASTTGEGFYCHYLHGMAKKVFFTFIAICPRFYFITPVSSSTRRREKTISSNVKKRVNKYVSIFSRDVVWVWY